MTRQVHLPPHLLDGPFAVTEARQLGVSHTTLRRKAFEAPFYGVRRRAATPATIRNQCEAAAQVLPPSAVFSHEAAAGLLDLPVRRGASRTVHLGTVIDVTVPDHLPQPRGRGIRGHRSLLRPEDVVDLGGIRVTSPIRTWCDLATRWSLDELVMLGDAIAAGERDQFGGPRRLGSSPRPRSPSLDDLRAAAAAWGARRGSRVLRQAVDLVRVGVDSPPETDLRLLVVRAGLPEPVVNLDIWDGLTWIHRPDLSWPRWRVGVDYDGEHHFTGGEARLRRDSSRREDLRSIGWLLPVVTSSDLYGRPLIVLRRIGQALREHGAAW